MSEARLWRDPRTAVYQLHYRLGGRRHSRSTKTRDRRKAEAILRESGAGCW